MDRPGRTCRDLARHYPDSYIVDIRRVKKTKEHGYAKGVAEVCKYALKFSDLSMENTFHAFLTLKGKKGSLAHLVLCTV